MKTAIKTKQQKKIKNKNINQLVVYRNKIRNGERIPLLIEDCFTLNGKTTYVGININRMDMPILLKDPLFIIKIATVVVTKNFINTLPYRQNSNVVATLLNKNWDNVCKSHIKIMIPGQKTHGHKYSTSFRIFELKNIQNTNDKKKFLLTLGNRIY